MKTSSQKLSNSHQLGPLVAVYRDRPLGWCDFFLFFLPASLAVLTPLGYGFWRGWYAQTRFGPALAENWQWPWFALSGLALIPLLWLALRRVRSAHRVITIYKDGVQIQGTNGFHQVVQWDEIDGITAASLKDKFLGFQIALSHHMTLQLKSGKTLKIDRHISGLDEIAARIKAKIYPKKLPELRTSLKTGKTLQFGPISLKSTGIGLRDENILWNQVKRINLQAGFLVVELYVESSKKIAVDQVPNIELLIQLIQEGVDV